MKQLICALGVSLLLIPAAALAQTPEQEMQAWAEASKPGQQHKYIEQFSGNWDVSATFWAAPGAQPMTSKGTSEHKMIMGGRYLHQLFKGEMMGAAFEGLGMWGYDNLKKEYVSTWLDSMSTGIMMAKGAGDAAGKSFTFTGEYLDPKGQTRKTKEVLRFESPAKVVAEMYEIGADGKEFKNMEMTYTRK